MSLRDRKLVSMLSAVSLALAGCTAFAQQTAESPDNLRTEQGSGSAPPPVASECVKAAPGWATQLTVGQWERVSLNTLASQDPRNDPDVNPNYPNSPPWNGTIGQRGVIEAWNGGAFACKYGEFGALIAYGGGHNDYYGSEIYAFDLGMREWRRVSDPYPGPNNWPYFSGRYPDGSAIPPHTYDYVDYDEVTHRFYIFKGQHTLGPPSNSTAVPVLHVFNLETLQWEDGGMNDGVTMFSGGFSAYDPRRNVFWVQGAPTNGAAFTRIDPSVVSGSGERGEFTNYPSHTAWANGRPLNVGAVGAIDPNNDIMVYPSFRDSQNVWARDLTRPQEQAIAINHGGQAPSYASATGWEWSPARNAFLYWRGGGQVHELKPPASGWRNQQWVWTRIANSSTSPTVPRNDNGPYSKFRVATFDEFDLAIVINEGTEGHVWVMRIPND
ncbi:MAG: hypothetical protein AAF290_06975 [Pseudomonadota bacterium]